MKKRQVGVSLSDSEIEHLKELGFQQDNHMHRSISWMAGKAIKEYLDRHPVKPKVVKEKPSIFANLKRRAG